MSKWLRSQICGSPPEGGPNPDWFTAWALPSQPSNFTSKPLGWDSGQSDLLAIDQPHSLVCCPSHPQTEQALKKKKGGGIEISLRLNDKGEVLEANPVNTLEYGLTELALYEVKYWWEFAPAFENGKAVASNHTVKVFFRIEEKEEDD